MSPRSCTEMHLNLQYAIWMQNIVASSDCPDVHFCLLCSLYMCSCALTVYMCLLRGGPLHQFVNDVNIV